MDVRYITINEEDLDDLPIIDGQIIALADTPRWYYDMDNVRYNASGTLYCGSLPPVDKALNGVIYILNRDPDSSEEDPENRLDGAYLFLDGEYIKVSQLYNPASANELGLVKVGTNIDVSEGGVISISNSKIKAIAGLATTYSTGLVRIGSGLNVTPSGIISVPVDDIASEVLDEIKTDPTVFPVADHDSIGVVRIGDNLSITNGLIDLSAQNISDALGYVPGHEAGTVEAAGSEKHPVYINTQGTPSATGYYLDVWTTGNGKAASYATSEGYMTTASGVASHCEGTQTWACNVYTHSEGNSSTAAGIGAHAQGYRTFAKGAYSDASVFMSTASGGYSIAGGFRAKATADSSIAFGRYANALADYSIVIGNNSTASKSDQIVIGSDGKRIEDYPTYYYESEYYDAISATSTVDKSTYVHGDVGNDYDTISLRGRYQDPYPVAGAHDMMYWFRTHTRTNAIPKPNDTKDRYYKYVSTYSYDLTNETKTPAYSDLTQILKFPLVMNSGFSYGGVSYQWSPIMTRILASYSGSTSKMTVKYASTMISGLLASNIQPLIYQESYGLEDVHIVRVPDASGSLVIFRCWYDTTSGAGTSKEATKSGTTYVRLYYVIPCDEWGSGEQDSANWTKFGCVAISLGAAAVGGSKTDNIGINWLNTKVLDDSEALSFDQGQFAFWCKVRDTYNDKGNGTAYYVSCAVYSLPSEPESFNGMWANSTK